MTSASVGETSAVFARNITSVLIGPTFYKYAKEIGIYLCQLIYDYYMCVNNYQSIFLENMDLVGHILQKSVIFSDGIKNTFILSLSFRLFPV